MKKRTFFLAALGMAMATQAFAESITFPNNLTVDGKKLVLNGIGWRKATFLKVKVYAGALYLENKSSDPAQILASESPKEVRMHFVHDVDAAKLRDAWKEGIEKNCKPDCAAVQAPLQKFSATMADVKDGDLMAVEFLKDRVNVSVKGAKPVTIEGAAFSKALLKIWLGDEPPNEDLKEGMLGKLKS